MKYTLKLITCFSLLFLMWLLENFQFHSRLALYFYWTALVWPPLATAVLHCAFSPMAGPRALQTSQRKLEICPESLLPQHLLHVSAKALRTRAPTFLPCLLDCEPLGVRHSVSGAPVRKQRALLWGRPSAVLSRQHCHTILAVHPSLHSEATPH